MTEHRTDVDGRLGEVLRDGERIGLRFVRRLHHPPEKVWRAITESENLRHWFPADIVGERRAGARVSLPFWPESVIHGAAEIEAAGIDLDDPTLPGQIRTWEPHRLFELVWGDTELLRFEITPEGDGTRLVFTTWLDDEPGPAGHAGTGAGYHACLDALEELLDHGAVAPAEGRDMGPLQEKYAALMRGSHG